jgi:hypothetical protein
LTRLAAVVVVGVLALVALEAQQRPEEHQHDAEKAQEIFCSTMTTGQLCSHGTADALQMSGAKRDEWLAAVRRYNKAVEDATKQLQVEAKTVLTPQQLTEVNRWFAVGLNPQINQVLASPKSSVAK